MKKLRTIIFITISVVLCYVVSCDKKQHAATVQSPYLNLNDTAQYVGMNTCKGCHEDIYKSYIKTGMGKSFDVASIQKTAADFTNQHLIFDTINDLYYQPYFKNDTFYIHEYRLQGVDTIHSLVQQVSYIIGSGQHTNSHLFNINGFVYQAPITFYTQAQKWDLAPGFEKGSNTRFKRIISDECMSCHNAYPTVFNESENKYKIVQQGIDCERCHGPGSIHSQQKKDGIIVDTTGNNYDYTIVNPRGLNRELQVDVCQRCHLQGITVLHEDNDYHTYKPGMKLSDVMDVFLPRYTDSDTRFLMASHADRMKQSKCYKQSEMTCISCHNPHISVKERSVEYWVSKCNNCHSGKAVCTETERNKQVKNNNCITCHMPLSATIDIPNVTIHNHAIIKQLHVDKQASIRDFVMLECVNNNSISALQQAKGYLAFYEEYTQKDAFLDSAAMYLNMSKEVNYDALIHLHYLRNDWKTITDLIEQNNVTTQMAWTNYRIGEAHLMEKNYEVALKYFNKALQKKALNLDFLNKKAVVLMQLNNIDEAKKTYLLLLAQNPTYTIALSNLGVLCQQEGDVLNAAMYYSKALKFDPDYKQALINKASLLMLQNKKNEALVSIKQLAKKYPTDAEVMLLIAKSKSL